MKQKDGERLVEVILKQLDMGEIDVPVLQYTGVMFGNVQSANCISNLVVHLIGPFHLASFLFVDCDCDCDCPCEYKVTTDSETVW